MGCVMVFTGMDELELVEATGAAPVPPGARGLMLPSWEAADALEVGLEPLLVEGDEKLAGREGTAPRRCAPRMAMAEAEKDDVASE